MRKRLCFPAGAFPTEGFSSAVSGATLPKRGSWVCRSVTTVQCHVVLCSVSRENGHSWGRFCTHFVDYAEIPETLFLIVYHCQLVKLLLIPSLMKLIYQMSCHSVSRNRFLGILLLSSQ